MVLFARLLFAALVLTACSSSTSQDSAPQDSAPQDGGSDDSALLSIDASTSTAALDDASTTAAPSTTAEPETGPTSSASPLRPVGDATPTSIDSSSTAYISRVSMGATAIELTWAGSTEGAVEYQIHRLDRTTDSEPAAAEMTDANLIHTATDGGRFVDDTVSEGTRYWFGVRALAADGTARAHAWHAADAVTDTTPPALVGDLTAEFVDGEALITWTTPEENYELHGYRVFRAVDDGELESLATTWRLNQTSLIDDELPASGTVTYGVAAFDFHWNDSDIALVELDLG